ncbi:MAG TPA: hypothetical protein VF719_10820, partial [Abditibacteriaceae bacterium]
AETSSEDRSTAQNIFDPTLAAKRLAKGAGREEVLLGGVSGCGVSCLFLALAIMAFPLILPLLLFLIFVLLRRL